MKKHIIDFKEKFYELVGYSIIDFPQEFQYYKDTSEQILSNSIFHSSTYGVTYLDLYEDVKNFIEKYGRTYVPHNSEYIFKSGTFIKGTFIYKLYKEESDKNKKIMEIKFKKGDCVTFVKISDDKFNGNHPNDINEGYTCSGILFHDIIIGERANISGLSTSDVEEILSEDTFKTKNSTYKVLLYEESNKN